MVAQRQLGDASRAMEIITLNNLKYPYIVEKGQTAASGVKQVGDTIILPSNDGSNDPNTVISTQEQHDILIFGSDLALIDGDLESDLYGDLAVASGIDCLKQDFMNQLLTQKGTMLYHPDYGTNFTAVVGNKKDGNWTQKAIIEITRLANSDDRLKGVKDIKLIDSNDSLYMEFTLITVSNGYIKVRDTL